MSVPGSQHRYCPNCGAHHYDTNLVMGHVKSMCCGDACRKQWEIKYARMLLRQSADEREDLRRLPINEEGKR
jgi:hypothetical protein